MSILEHTLKAAMMRGGTSKGLFVLKAHLPARWEDQEKLLLTMMNPLTGLGGDKPTSNKIAIIDKYVDGRIADVSYLSGQVKPGKIDTTLSCGNTLAAVGPFAIQEGLLVATHPETRVRIFCENTGVIVHSIVQTPNCQLSYEGETQVDGVPGKWAAIKLNYLNAVGAKTGKLLPTGRPQDILDGIRISWVDVAVPTLFIHADDLGLKGNEDISVLGSVSFLTRLEEIRQKAALLAGLERDEAAMRISIVSPAGNVGAVTSRCFTTAPLTVHSAHPVQVALSLTAACYIPGKVAAEVATLPSYGDCFMIEHPQGVIGTSISLEKDSEGGLIGIPEVGIVTTANAIMRGEFTMPFTRIKKTEQ